MRALAMFIWIGTYQIIHVSSNSKPPCRTYKSSKVSEDGIGDTTTQRCDENPNYPFLVSCGFSAKDNTEQQFGGSYISGDACIAKNAAGGAGVWAWARCCKFEQTVSCAATTGPSVTNDNTKSTVTCSSQHIMLGCSGYTEDAYFDGTYVGTVQPDAIIHTGTSYPEPLVNSCTAQDGVNSKWTRANIHCCTADLGLDCNIYYQQAGTDNILSCPSHQTMMSCNAWNTNRDPVAWYIENNSQGGRCVTKSRDTTGIYTSAICCSEVTLSPTPAPTDQPTPRPTNVPTTTPTTTPTTITAAPTAPTNMPTENPTRTRNPTADPTTSTLAPTSTPSFSPSESTSDPTTAPSIAPSPAPTRKTRDPTQPPTIAPSTAPSEDTPSPTAAPTAVPISGRAKNEENVLGNNETLYLILFIIFGVLFLGLLLGVTYYCWKNKKQSNEVNYNNAHVAVASSPSPLNKYVDASDGIVMSNIEGANATTTNDETPGTNVIDASVGIKTTTGATHGNNLTSGNSTGNTGRTGASPGGSYNAGVDGMSDKEYDNYLKDVNEDDQKQEVFKVSM